MKMTFACEPDDAFLRVTLEGDYPTDNLPKVVAEIREAQLQYQANKILINALAVEAPQSEFQRYAVGELLSSTFGSQVKIVIVYPAEITTKFTETVAVNRGTFLRIMPSEAEAIDWLLNGAA